MDRAEIDQVADAYADRFGLDPEDVPVNYTDAAIDVPVAVLAVLLAGIDPVPLIAAIGSLRDVAAERQNEAMTTAPDHEARVRWESCRDTFDVVLWKIREARG